MVNIITLNKTKPPKETIGGFPVKKKRRLRIRTNFPDDGKQKRIQSRPLPVTNYSEYLSYYRCVPLANQRPTHSACDVCGVTTSSVMPSSTSTTQLPPINGHKFIIPHARHYNYLGVSDCAPGSGNAVRRRFSNVSDVVTRKISTTIGWRSSSFPIHDVVSEGKTLCGQYIRCRLKRSGVYNRKSGLQWLHSLTTLPGDHTVSEVFPELLSIGQELERMHPSLYTGVARQVSSSPGGGVLATDKAVNNVMTSVGREMFRTEITWAKVVSLFAVAGGLAVDCVRQGHPEYLQCVIESTGEVLEDEVASWIAINGGWLGLLSYCKPPTNEISLVGFVGLLGVVMASALFLFLLLRWFTKFVFC